MKPIATCGREYHLLPLAGAAALALALAYLDPWHMEAALLRWTQQSLFAPPEASDVIAVVLDGQESSTPPRVQLARVLQAMRAAPPRLTVITLPLSNPYTPPGLLEVDRAMAWLAAQAGPASAETADWRAGLATRLQAASQALDADQALQAALAGMPEVLLAIPAQPSAGAAPAILAANSEMLEDGYCMIAGSELAPVAAEIAHAPNARFQPTAPSAIALNPQQNTVPLLAAVGQHWCWTLPVAALAAWLSTPISEARVQAGMATQLRLGTLDLPISSDGTIRITALAAGVAPLAPTGIRNGEIPPARFAGKLAVIGMGTDTLAQAQAIAALLQPQSYSVTPAWQPWAQWLAALATLVLMGWAARLSWLRAATLAVLALAGWLLLQSAWLLHWQSWAPLTGALWLAVLGAILPRWRTLWPVTPRAVEGEPQRVQGLALQGQGDLEKAFETFQRCPMDGLMMGLLYNLGLDFERRRQPREATDVYQYMAKYNPTFRDLPARLQKLANPRKKRLANTIQLSAWLEDISTTNKPMLGRYQIERKLAKGAMGMVYLGKDPKLDRWVAIKTLNLSQEFDGPELREATARFFREAGAAGRLSHPYIVQVYDAGEEHDLAYISMEFSQGGDLSPYTKPDALLPVETVVDIMIKACEALDYAHRQGVIHRDIKPANVLYNPETGLIKLSDFGIARIVDADKTKTGVVLGTPSYMSPEQLAGKPLDGRTDLFSVGIMLYQLLAGELPFTAESMASLMFKIATEQTPDIGARRPGLPACLKEALMILMQKNPADRYANGAAAARALRECLPQCRNPALPGSTS